MVYYLFCSGRNAVTFFFTTPLAFCRVYQIASDAEAGTTMFLAVSVRWLCVPGPDYAAAEANFADLPPFDFPAGT
jgi:hypothetical protein